MLLGPAPAPEAARGVSFDDISGSSGISRFHHVSGQASKPYLPETAGSGVALFDYDNDGWLDIYLINGLSQDAHSGKTSPETAKLFHNNHNSTFSDVTAKAGVENHRWGMGVCVGDFDNDGWSDLYVTNLGPNRLYKNNTDGTFSDVAVRAGVSVNTWSTRCAFGDYDGDARLDLYVAGYVDFDWNNLPPPGPSELHSGRPDSGSREGSVRFSAAAATGAAYDPGNPHCSYLGTHVACGPLGLKGAPDFLFRNRGDDGFEDVTAKAGVVDLKGRYGFGVAWVDVDDDRRLDLVVANDSNPNFLYHNKGDGTFREIGLLSGLGTNADGRAQAYMGVAVGDYDHDGKNDFFFTTFSNDSYTLFRNLGRLDFSEVTQQAALSEVTIPFLGWGTEFFDYDNDGWLDILAVNGHVYPQADPVAWNSSYMQRTLLFRNLRSGRFADVKGSLGTGFTKPKASRGAAVGDLFNDGDLDVVINNIDSRPTLLKNVGGSNVGHWLTLRLIGDPAKRTPRDGVGSTVFCSAGGFRQRGAVASGRGYLSQSDQRIHFGLGTSNRIEKLEVLGPTVTEKASFCPQ